MRYIKIEFTAGALDGVAYQKVNRDGVVVEYLDEQGTKIDLVDNKGAELEYEACVVEDNATPPFATEDVVEVAPVAEVAEESMPQTVDELEAKIRSVIESKK